MPENQWLHEELRSLRQDMTVLHQTTRAELQGLGQQILAKLESHAEDDRLVANRVLVIETQRSEEAKQSMKRGTWAGILAAGGITGTVEIVKHWLAK